ncbi:MAG: amino acid permease [Elusimicrobia bacterium]|nr:amino acid permease [Elusimicrobiota bacterium]
MGATQPLAAGSLRRELGLFDATMLVVGSMIGSGIFIVSADIARTMGGAGWLLVVWLITAAMTLAAALSYGELACMMPGAGGQYVYLREAYGPLTSFLYGWTLFLVIQTGTIAAVAVAFAKFFAVLVPWFSEKHILLSAGPLRVSAAQALAIVVIAALTGLNLRGLRHGRLIQNVFTVAKAAALGLLIVLALTVGRNAGSLAANLAGAWDAAWTRLADGRIAAVEPLGGLGVLCAIGVAMVGSLFSSVAWENATFTAGETADPRRNVPLSLILGTGIVTALYLLANLGYLAVLPVAGSPEAADALGRGIQFALNDRVGTAAMSAILGPAGETLMALLIMVSTFGCVNGIVLSGARVYYAMAQDGLFFRRVGTLNDRSVPGVALVVQGVWAGVLCLSGTYGDLLDYVVFAVLIFYCLTVAGVFILRWKRPLEERPYKTWGYPAVPALYILAGAALCADLLALKPLYTWPGVAIVLSGIPVYAAWRRGGR